MQRSKPDTCQSPYPAYQSHFPADRPQFVMELAGIQSRPASAGHLLSELALALLRAE